MRTINFCRIWQRALISSKDVAIVAGDPSNNLPQPNEKSVSPQNNYIIFFKIKAICPIV